MFRRLISIALLVAFAPLASLPAWAGIDQLSRQEFEALSHDLSLKVDLFAEAWKAHPEAEFYGGSARDFLYWVKGKFREAHSREEALRIAKELRSRPKIEAREFIVGESDVDVLANGRVSLDPQRYGIKNIDSKPLAVVDPASELGRSERMQGHLPVEKIRLRKSGFVPPGDMGDGVGEMYKSVFSAHFTPPEVFKQSKYALAGDNHPVLLALRYIRIQAANYYQTHGSGYPNEKALLAGLEPKSAAEAKAIIDQAVKSGELAGFLERDAFQRWLNGSIQKAFRSYTNPNAARMLMKHFGVDKLQELHANRIEHFNQYLFARAPNEANEAAMRKKFNVKEKEFFQKPATYFPDGYLYHGTKAENFRNIVLQGALNSESGSGGPGLYGTGEKSRAFAENYRGDPKYTVKFKIEPQARIVDITQGEGARVFKAFGKSESEFAQAFGVDIIRYPYSSAEAFVVKNSSAIGKAEGVYLQILPLGEMIERLRKARDLGDIVEAIALGQYTSEERKMMWAHIGLSEPEIFRQLVQPKSDRSAAILKNSGASVLWDAVDLGSHLEDPGFFAALKNGGLSTVRVLEERLKQGTLLNEPRTAGILIDGLSENSWQTGHFHQDLAKALLAHPEKVSADLAKKLLAEDSLVEKILPLFDRLPAEEATAAKKSLVRRKLASARSSPSLAYEVNVVEANFDWWKNDLAFAEEILDGLPNGTFWATYHQFGEAMRKNPDWIGSPLEKKFFSRLPAAFSFWQKTNYGDALSFEQRAERMPALIRGWQGDSSEQNRLLVDFLRDPRSVRYPKVFWQALSAQNYDAMALLGPAFDTPHWPKEKAFLRSIVEDPNVYLPQFTKVFLAREGVDPELKRLALERAGQNLEAVYRSFSSRDRQRGGPLEAAYSKAAAAIKDADRLFLDDKPLGLAIEVLQAREAMGLPTKTSGGSSLFAKLFSSRITKESKELANLDPNFLLSLLRQPELGKELQYSFAELFGRYPHLRMRGDLIEAYLAANPNQSDGFLNLALAKLSLKELEELPWWNEMIAKYPSLLKPNMTYADNRQLTLLSKLAQIPNFKAAMQGAAPGAEYLSLLDESEWDEILRARLKKGELPIARKLAHERGKEHLFYRQNRIINELYREGLAPGLLADPSTDRDLKLRLLRNFWVEPGASAIERLKENDHLGWRQFTEIEKAFPRDIIIYDWGLDLKNGQISADIFLADPAWADPRQYAAMKKEFTTAYPDRKDFPASPKGALPFSCAYHFSQMWQKARAKLGR